MLVRRHSHDYNFLGDTETGVTMRWGATVDENPLRAPWPELADISISNHCSAGCAYCYRDSSANNSFMPLEDYCRVLDALTSPQWGSVFQVALGGGEPLEHPQLEEILRVTRDRGIIANFTTNAISLTADRARTIAPLVGAVAVSVSDLRAIRADKIRYLTDAGVRVNLHFILDAESITQATDLLRGRSNPLPDGVNAIVFLTYKPRGRANADRCLKPGAELDAFLCAVNEATCNAHVGFDACFVPLLMSRTNTVIDYVDSCECAFFSVYVDEQMNVRPCSFATGDRDKWNLHKNSMGEIWNFHFEAYRDQQIARQCQSECEQVGQCHGNCAYFSELQLCLTHTQGV